MNIQQTQPYHQSLIERFSPYLKLIKLKVVSVMLCSSLIGMLMTPSADQGIIPMIFGLLGIGLCASGAASANRLFEIAIDTKMHRTQHRPLVKHILSPRYVSLFSLLCIILGSLLLMMTTNSQSTLVTLATTVGYAMIYTRWLKPSTPQNIVIGGLSGAMPPLLGWLCLKPSLDVEPVLMVLIIFLWTPAHFWPLAIHYYDDYKQSQLPMLPVTHGITFTQWSILAYVVLTCIATTLPFVVGMCSWPYLMIVSIMGGRWIWLSVCFFYRNHISMYLFKYSITYLMTIFLAMILDRLTI